MLKKIVIFFCFCVFAFSQSSFGNPQPSFDNPRKVVYSLYVNDLDTVNQTIGSIYNILKEYPSESLKVVVVVYGKGMRVLKNDYDKDTQARIKSLMQYDVEFIGCKNTMQSMNWTEDDFMDGISYTQAGIVELIERKVDGYIGIVAY
ncbi:DsrE family protein [Aliarcobacter skirrowii]|uniref:DsrE family protein n=1 Tax=Aliarcobacter skirrowii TaxID=28200 RepID=UPI0008243FB1|nr:DsrE family protein [Aliarcobacter skirrowii]